MENLWSLLATNLLNCPFNTDFEIIKIKHTTERIRKWAHQFPIHWVKGVPSPRIKRPFLEVLRLRPCSVQVNNTWRYKYISPYTFMACTKTILSFTCESLSYQKFTVNMRNLIFRASRLLVKFSKQEDQIYATQDSKNGPIYYFTYWTSNCFVTHRKAATHIIRRYSLLGHKPATFMWKKSTP